MTKTMTKGLKMSRINGLIATYNDLASTENEVRASYRLVCNMIEKATECSRWTSSNIFYFLSNGEMYFDDTKLESIHNATGQSNIIQIVINVLQSLGINYKLVSTEKGYGKNYKSTVYTFIKR